MSKIIPFNALIPNEAKASQVVCPPYDIIDENEARMLFKRNPNSLIQITRPEVNFPDGTNPYLDSVYKEANNKLLTFIETKLLIEDKKALYVYQIKSDIHSQVGLVCGVSVEEYKHNKIKKHEKIRSEKETDRAKLSLNTMTHAEPVILTHKTCDSIKGMLNTITAANEPIYDVKDQFGFSHVLWKVQESDVDKIIYAYDKIPSLYIADGHHRSAAAAKVQDVLRSDNHKHKDFEYYDYFPAVIFPSDELKVYEYNWSGPENDRPLAKVTIDDIMQISDKNEIMPPKSTWFAPKLISGLFLYRL